MEQDQERKYTINIDPKILELLGPNLYTNINYVLAELIANAYDADARNVYIISKTDRIIVEDDGSGMSYSERDIDKYLNVAVITRVSSKNSRTPKYHRLKMGRKGVGKLSALAVSENVLVKTIKDNEKSGFILTRHISEDRKLQPLSLEEITFEKVHNHGTAIEMLNPEYDLPRTLDSLKRNIVKIFPLVNDTFRIHLIRNDEEVIVDNFESETISELSTLITLGEPFDSLAQYYKCDFEDKRELLYDKRPSKVIPVDIINNAGDNVVWPMEIKGWIGTYRSTRGRKRSLKDFQDNFISLFANNKMGEFNILPYIGQNKLTEVFVVGQLYIDAFEESSLPDMALSNRQGYRTGDIRYKYATNYIRKVLLPDILKKREDYAKLANKDKDRKKYNDKKDKELKFKNDVEKFKTNTAESVAEKISKTSQNDYNSIKRIVNNEIKKSSGLLGLKPEIDIQKKKILISHTKADKDLCDIIYQMLLFNGVASQDIIYTNCDESSARIPEGVTIYDYLRDFFVDSVSQQKIYVIYVTSKAMGAAWGAVSEVGAGWITQVNNKIFNIGSFKPQHPLDDSKQWLQVKRYNDDIYTDTVNFDIFCEKIEDLCKELQYDVKSHDDNLLHLAKYVNVLKSKEYLKLPEE